MCVWLLLCTHSVFTHADPKLLASKNSASLRSARCSHSSLLTLTNLFFQTQTHTNTAAGPQCKSPPTTTALMICIAGVCVLWDSGCCHAWLGLTRVCFVCFLRFQLQGDVCAPMYLCVCHDLQQSNLTCHLYFCLPHSLRHRPSR